MRKYYYLETLLIQVDRFVFNIQVHRTKMIKLLIPYIRKIKNHENKKNAAGVSSVVFQVFLFKQKKKHPLY